MTDEELITGCKNRNNDARRLLYTRYCDQLYTVALHILNDRTLSNDILHDSFIKIYKDIVGLRNNNSLSAWMRKIVVNISLQTIKRNKKITYNDELVKDDSIEWNEPMSGESLDKAFFMLPDGYRIVFSMIVIEGYKHHEVAKILGISEGTSKSQLFNAKRSLRKMLSNNI